MPDTQDKDTYVLLERTGTDGKITPTLEGPGEWVVSIASPAEDSTTLRDREERQVHEEVSAAVRDFFTRMRDAHLPGVLDTGPLRAWHQTDLDFTQRLTEEIADDLPDLDDDDFRDDDFDNHPLSELREAMVDNCPAFSGEEPGVEF